MKIFQSFEVKWFILENNCVNEMILLITNMSTDHCHGNKW